MNLFYFLTGIILQAVLFCNTSFAQSQTATVTLTLDHTGAILKNEELTLRDMRVLLPKSLRLLKLIRSLKSKTVPHTGKVQVVMTTTPGEGKAGMEISVKSGGEKVETIFFPGAPLVVTPPPPKEGAPMYGASYEVVDADPNTGEETISFIVPPDGEYPDLDIPIDINEYRKAKPGDIFIVKRKTGKALFDFKYRREPATVPGDQVYWFPVPDSIPENDRLVQYTISYLDGHLLAACGSGLPGLALGEEIATDKDYAVSFVKRNGARYIRMRCRFHNLYLINAFFADGDLTKETSMVSRWVGGQMEGGSALEILPGPYDGWLSVYAWFDYQKDPFDLVWELEKYLDNTVYKVDPKAFAIVFRFYEDNNNGTAWCKFDIGGFSRTERLLAKALEAEFIKAGHRYKFTWGNRRLLIDLIGYKRYNVESGKFILKTKAGDGMQISTTGEQLVEFREWGRTEIIRGKEKAIVNGKVLGEREWITLTEMDKIYTCEMKNGSVTKSSLLITAPTLWKSIVDGYYKYNDPYKYVIATIQQAGWKRNGATRNFAGMQGEVWEHSKLGSMSVTDSVTAVPLFSSAIVGPVKSEIEVVSFTAGKQPDERFKLPIPKESIKPLSLPKTSKGPFLPGVIKQL